MLLRLSRGYFAIALALASLAAPTCARRATAQATQLPPFVELRVPKGPTLAAGAGTSFLVYEMHVTNLTAVPTTIKRIEVVGASGAGGAGRVLQTLEDTALVRALSRPGVNPRELTFADRPRLGGGLRAVVFFWVPVDPRTAPTELRHRVTVTQGIGDSVRTSILEGAAARVDRDIAVITPPLRGGPWVAINGPDSLSGHRRALITVNGNPTIAERFAMDLLQVDSAGHSYSGDRLKNESYYAHGKEALAVADGLVAATKDSIPENVPGGRAVPITLETVGGNHVVIDIGHGHYAFYAHLRPGSLRVHTGDHVKRGQVIGLVGNSGNSTEPHLHFHIMDGTSPLGSEGLPYAYEAFDLIGRCRGPLTDCARTAPATHRHEIPMANMIVRFP